MKNNKIAFLSFYGSLNDFLSPKIRKNSLPVSFDSSATIKDIIESCGVPHTEVDLILVQTTPVTFSFHPENNDRIAVFPCQNLSTAAACQHLQQPPPQPLTFILDVHLGKLARFLRMLGFDSLYSNKFNDKEIVTIASEQKRIILTRDIGILKYRSVRWGYWVRSTIPHNQYLELANRFNLCSLAQPFSICINCNGLLVRADKEELLSLLEPKTKQYFSSFKQCSSCKKIYWEGSHLEKMKSVIEKICKDLKTGE